MLKYLLLLSFLVGCNSDIYYWGKYQDDIYKMYISPEDITPSQQISHLHKIIEKANNTEDKKVPPGVYIHLAYMYYETGQDTQAYESLKIEKELFPESTQFIDGIIKRANKN